MGARYKEQPYGHPTRQDSGNAHRDRIACCLRWRRRDGDRATPPANSPPVASFTATPASGPAPLTVQFDASASHDPDGSIVSYTWNFGDYSAGVAGVTASHSYPTGGIYTVTLSATDNLGAPDGSLARSR